MDEQELSNVFETLLKDNGLSLNINPANYSIKSPAAIDIEHDEEGNLVGIGVYDGLLSLYFTEVSPLLVESLLGVCFIAHNGKSDFEQLRAWGIPVSQSQLIWD